MTNDTLEVQYKYIYGETAICYNSPLVKDTLKALFLLTSYVVLEYDFDYFELTILSLLYLHLFFYLMFLMDIL